MQEKKSVRRPLEQVLSLAFFSPIHQDHHKDTSTDFLQMNTRIKATALFLSLSLSRKSHVYTQREKITRVIQWTHDRNSVSGRQRPLKGRSEREKRLQRERNRIWGTKTSKNFYVNVTAQVIIWMSVSLEWTWPFLWFIHHLNFRGSYKERRAGNETETDWEMASREILWTSSQKGKSESEEETSLEYWTPLLCFLLHDVLFPIAITHSNRMFWFETEQDDGKEAESRYEEERTENIILMEW